MPRDSRRPAEGHPAGGQPQRRDASSPPPPSPPPPSAPAALASSDTPLALGGDAGGISEQARRAWLQLALVPGIGPRTFRRLTNRFGGPGEVFAASPAQLREVPGVGPQLASRLAAAAASGEEVEREVEICRRHNVQIVLQHDPQYPALLRKIHDPPPLLFIRGEFTPADLLAVAIVGTRHATHYGRTQAERLAAGLARRGLTVVSGMARGIDAAAHQGALKAQGRTVAVLGGGVLNVYPPEHSRLAVEIASRGAVISEAPPLRKPMSGAFPQRNRLISGLSLGVIVVEAAHRSGAFISVQHALEQGREVFAVPGRIDSRMSQGCHRLIQEGAKLVEDVDDVLEELGVLMQEAAQCGPAELPAPPGLKPEEQRVLDAIDDAPTSVEGIIEETGLPVPHVLAALSTLELRHLIHRVSGNLVCRRGPARE